MKILLGSEVLLLQGYKLFYSKDESVFVQTEQSNQYMN